MPVSERPILILGGTAEAAKLAARLVSQGHRVISSLAGRTREPAILDGEVRIGGFGGARGLTGYIARENVSLLIDATHPFATQISDNALIAAASTKIPFVRLERPAWHARPGDNWTSVTSIEEAVSAIPARARVLLALGRQHIAPFSRRGDVHFVVRMIDPPEQPLDLVDFELELSKPGKVEDEAAFLAKRRLTHIVCRNSGGSASYTKIKAARELGLPVIIIDRPHRPVAHTLPDIESVGQFIDNTLGSFRA
ncbi:cobalt-precorrin-6A reductase [Phyllobacterium brassicacearum]|uniref:Cobalt-precorrin-6A reductase n=1 Tax=Phyllobacterium brassicacearum TaxID=314235 RepID=A0A2P7BTI9_9HYPH|nr:cobalt-precorrin-6A reductase [Phyllobacterium brassicacearum]TDQ34964.1 precorrin-6A reductase [Phyllobacterium brassicacearum]